MTLTILRTAAGSAPSPSQYRFWQRLGVRVVAVDADPLSVGFYVADAAYVVPYVSDPGYLTRLLEICERENVNAFLPALDEELVLVGQARQAFEQKGTKVLLSPDDSLRICTDKLATYTFFAEHAIPTVQTFYAENLQQYEISTYPQVIKPRRGRGSTNVFQARTWEEVSFLSKYVQDAVVQPFLKGTEYTIDVFANHSHEPIVIAPRKRIDTDSGISYKGSTSWHDDMVYWAGRLITALRLVGPANIQCFVTSADELYFTEVNARLAGSVVLSVAAGVPLLENTINLLVDRPLMPHLQPLNEDRVMLRYWEEIYLSEAEAKRFGWRGMP